MGVAINPNRNPSLNPISTLFFCKHVRICIKRILIFYNSTFIQVSICLYYYHKDCNLIQTNLILIYLVNDVISSLNSTKYNKAIYLYIYGLEIQCLFYLRRHYLNFERIGYSNRLNNVSVILFSDRKSRQTIFSAYDSLDSINQDK